MLKILGIYYCNRGALLRAFIAICLIFSLYVCFSCSNSSCDVATVENSDDTLRIAFVGDVLLDRGVRKVIERNGVDALFCDEVDSVFAANDMVIANLECPTTKIEEPVNKRFIFRAEPECLQALHEHGITHLNMANNHTMDQGRDGLSDTELQIKKYGMVPLGFGRNIEESVHPVLLAEYPRRVYLITSLQVPSENWMYLDGVPCVSESSIETIVAQIDSLKTEDSNACVIVMLHWGCEHTLEPIARQVQQARQMIVAGADCIIGHHSHTVQSSEVYNGKPIFYGIGNFIFDQNKRINTLSEIVTLSITKDTLCFSEHPVEIRNCVPHLVR